MRHQKASSRSLWLASALLLAFIAATALLPAVSYHAVEAALAAPQPLSPANGVTLPGIGPAALQWTLPEGSTQIHLQVTPFNGDGPGVNLIRGAVQQFSIPAPPEWYVLLPDMSYRWRVRVTDKPAFAPEDDPSWSAWSAAFSFKTPALTRQSLSPLLPADGSAVAAGRTLFRWQDSAPDVFYYEIQVSGDERFDPDPATAVSFVWWNLVHGGVTAPVNSWLSPALDPSATYYWRVRPRVQGDGAPVAWGPSWRFSTLAGPTTPTPTATPRATQTPTPGPSPTATATATATPAPTATPAGLQSRLAFVSTRDGNFEIYRMNVDGAGVRRLTDDPQVDDRPAWSPDGKKIVYESVQNGAKQLYLMNADGSDAAALTADSTRNEHAAWSPDGGWLAFVSGGQVNIMRSDGPYRLALSATAAAEQPAWLPSGNEIAYISGKQGSGSRRLCRIAMTGAGLSCTASIANINGSFHWSSRMDRYAWTCDVFREEQLCLSGQESRTGGNHLAPGHSPNWAPDASKLAFVSIRDGHQQIFTVNWDGSGLSRLVTHKSENFSPVWSPDGAKIAFISDRDGSRDIFVMNADGTGQTNLTKNGALEAFPVWSSPIDDRAP